MNNLSDILTKSKNALSFWAAVPIEKRIEILKNFAKKVEENSKALATLISQEMGKPLWESLTEVQAVSSKIQISIDAYFARNTENQKILGAGKSITRYKPHGIALVLGPFNFPVHLPNGHIVPALLAGNTVVFKPSEVTPKTGQFYSELWQMAGLPDGVLQIVQGGKELGAALLDQDFQSILFTGSLPVGLSILEKFVKRPDVLVALEMGGNNPLIVTRVSNLVAACYQTLQSAFLTSGQRCTAARRLILPYGPAGDRFLKELVQSIQCIQVGYYDAVPEPFMGPIATAQGAKKVYDAWINLVSLGGKSLYEMRKLKGDPRLLSPGLIDITGIESLPDEEIFGPLLQVIRVKDFDAAIVEANKTKFGLSAGLLSDSKEEYELFYQKIRAGIINWNTPLTGASSAAPFGGVGYSGNGRPSALFAVDYVSYPVASIEQAELKLPEKFLPGLVPISKPDHPL